MRTSVIIHSGQVLVAGWNDDGKPIGLVKPIVERPAEETDLLVTFWGSNMSAPLVSYGIAEGFLTHRQIYKMALLGWGRSD